LGGRDAIRGRVDDRSSWRYSDNALQMADGRWQMAHGRWHMAGGRLGGNGPDPEQEATWELATAGPAGWRLSLSAAQRRCVGGGPGGRLRGPQEAGLTDRAERGRAGRRSRQPADPASRAAGSREHRSLGRGARGGAAGGGRPAELGRLTGGAARATRRGRGGGNAAGRTGRCGGAGCDRNPLPYWRVEWCALCSVCARGRAGSVAGPVVEKPDGLCNARRRDVPGGGATPLPGFLRRLSRQGAAALVGCAVCAAALRIFTGLRECARGGAVDAPSGLFSRVPSECFGDDRLSGTGVRVLGGLLNGLWSGADAVFVSRGELARELGLSVRTVQRAVRELVAAGYVRRELRATRGGRRHCLALGFRLRGRREPAASDDCGGGDSSVTQGCQIWRGGVSEVTPSPGPPLKRRENQLEIGFERQATTTSLGGSSSPAESAVSVEELQGWVDRCRAGGSSYRGNTACLRMLVAGGADLGPTDATPVELGVWLSRPLECADGRLSRQRSAAAGLAQGAAPGPCGAEGDRTLNLSIANAALVGPDPA